MAKRRSLTIFQYLKKHDISALEFANKIGVHPQTIYRWSWGVEPQDEHKAKIESVTEGEVFFGDAA